MLKLEDCMAQKYVVFVTFKRCYVRFLVINLITMNIVPIEMCVEICSLPFYRSNV